ncbi:MAG: hypothetical protein JXA69_02195 [Phycisphaerae bacterium]|nr:hypothetical protein [Phycisphaerae bacterium]
MRRMTASVIGIVMLSVGVCAQAMTGDDRPDNQHVWRPGVRSVAVFKNGIGFFVREGKVTLRDGWCMAEAVPPALFGTLAICSLDEGRAVDIVGAGLGETVEFDGRDGPKDVAGKLARLRSVMGLNVALTYTHHDATQTVSGTLTDVTEEFAILEQDGRLHAIRLDELSKLQALDYPLRVHVEGAETPDESAELAMAYLRKGVTWVPEYTLRVLDDETAELTLRATLVNEVEDLINADIHFVVGVPSFIFAEYLTPIAVGQAIKAVAAAVPDQFMSQLVSNAIMTRAGVAQDERAGLPTTQPPQPEAPVDVDGLLGSLPQMGGAGASDFAVYTKSGMTVRRGEKAIVTLFRVRVPYTHRYRWSSPGDLKHYLVLHNESETPWTTGPVIAVSEQRPLCQDRITYTPRGSRYELPVTTAVNIATGQSETEIARKLKAHEPAHNVFLDLVTIEGRVHVRNYESRPADLVVSRTVAGLLTTASHDGVIQQDVSELRLTERRGSVSWSLALKPGESREMTYRYERYVPSQ